MYTYQYPRPALTVDAIILKEPGNQLLLIQRGRDPYSGKWALPGGFVDMDELLDDACRRELAEETGLEVGDLTLFCIADRVDRDPRGRTISILYTGTVPDHAIVRSGDDACDARWFSLGELPELAFDHADLIARFKTQMEGK